jgi:hypothetical protein
VSAEPTDVGDDRAVVDRIVDDRTAVLLVGPTGREHHVSAEQLPEGATDGTWVVLDPSTDPVTVLRIDDELTRARFRDLSARLETIRRQRRGGRFDRGTP